MDVVEPYQFNSSDEQKEQAQVTLAEWMREVLHDAVDAHMERQRRRRESGEEEGL